MLSQISRGSTEEKLRWIFKLYDCNSDGYISRAEMLQIVRAIYEMLGDSTRPLVSHSSAPDHVERIFKVSHHADSHQVGSVEVLVESQRWSPEASIRLNRKATLN